MIAKYSVLCQHHAETGLLFRGTWHQYMVAVKDLLVKEYFYLEIKTITSWLRGKMTVWSVELWNQKFRDVTDIHMMGSTAN